MSTITALIDELQTIANASTAIQSFDFWDDDVIDADKGRQYPNLQIGRRMNIAPFNATTRHQDYTVVFVFSDLYHRADDADTPSQDAIGDLHTIAQQYFSEFNRRQNTLYRNDWSRIEAINGRVDFDQSQDRLIRLTYSTTITVRGNCTDGTFNYD